MKHLSKKNKNHLQRRAKYQLKKTGRVFVAQLTPHKAKSLERKKKDLKKYLKQPRLKYNSERRKFIKKFYQPRRYEHGPLVEAITGELGLEHDVDKFINFSCSIIDAETNHLSLNFSEATRIWPSAITMFVSLIEWVKLTSSHPVRIASSDSKSDQVNDYLSHCGFYDYVKRDFSSTKSMYSANEVVKIEQENSPRNTKIRQRAILDLVFQYSTLNADDIERLDCKVLSEIFVNVTEHGVATNVSGWFVLAQYHKRTGIISLCIADNGIGIKNSLQTGFQSEEIRQLLNSEDDAEYIEIALKKYVSGALDSVDIESKLFGMKHEVPKGKKRGKGLKYVVDTCKQLGLRLTLCSHYGAISLSEAGTIDFKRTLNRRCFAGTLYHIVIPAKKETVNVA